MPDHHLLRLGNDELLEEMSPETWPIYKPCTASVVTRVNPDPLRENSHSPTSLRWQKACQHVRDDCCCHECEV